MAESIKFTEEELQSITKLQTQYNQITMAAGQLYLNELSLNQRKEDLNKALEDTRKEENDVANKLTEKYGKGSLDINTGEFTPAPDEAQVETEIPTEAPAQE